MANNNSISQRIVLEGAEQVIALFEKMGKAGEDALTQIGNASKKENVFERIGNDVGTVFTRIGELATAVLGATTAFVALENAASTTIVEMAKLADQSGTTIQNISALSQIVGQFGVHTNQLPQVFSGLAQKVEQLWPRVTQAVRDSANKQIADMLAIQRATDALALSQINLEQIDRQLANQRVANSQSVADAQLNLAEARNKLAQLQGNELPFNPQDIAQARAALAVQQARLRLTEAQQKAARDAEEADIKAADAKLQRDTLQLQRDQLIKKSNEDKANDINNLAKFVDNLSKGIEDSSLKVNQSVDNLIRGIVAASGAGINGVGDLAKSIGEIGTATPSTFEAMKKLADVFANMKDRTLAAAVAAGIWGRKIGPEMLAFLSQGSAAIEEQIKRIDALGITFDKNDAKVAQAFRGSFTTLVNTIAAVTDKIAALFAPLGSEVLDKVRTAIEQNFGSIKAFAENVRDTITPIVRAITNVLLGIKAPSIQGLSGKSLLDAIDVIQAQAKIQGFVTSIKTFFTSIEMFVTDTLPTAFSKLRDLLDSTAGAINRLFGTKLTGDELGVSLLVGQFLGLNKAIIDVMGLVVNLGLLLVGLALLNPFAALIVAAALLGAAIVLNWDKIQAFLVGIWNQLVADWNATVDLWAQRVQAFVGAILGAWEAIKNGASGLWADLAAGFDSVISGIANAFNGMIDGIISRAQAALQAIKDFFANGLDAVPGGQVGASPFASGGYVRGPGSGTSDSILARLSNGEFVIRAAAVQHFGAAFFHALNALRTPAFSAGGLVDAFSRVAIPRFANGGLVAAGAGGLHPVNISIDGRRLRGLFATPSSLEDLKRSAVMEQISSSGSDPSWRR